MQTRRNGDAHLQGTPARWPGQRGHCSSSLSLPALNTDTLSSRIAMPIKTAQGRCGVFWRDNVCICNGQTHVVYRLVHVVFFGDAKRPPSWLLNLCLGAAILLELDLTEPPISAELIGLPSPGTAVNSAQPCCTKTLPRGGGTMTIALAIYSVICTYVVAPIRIWFSRGTTHRWAGRRQP